MIDNIRSILSIGTTKLNNKYGSCLSLYFLYFRKISNRSTLSIGTPKLNNRSGSCLSLAMSPPPTDEAKVSL